MNDILTPPVVDPASRTEVDAAAPERTKRPTVSCVVPCRDEAVNLQRLLPQLADVLAGCASAWEVVLVDDGSRDATAEVMREWSRLPGFRAIELSRNFGKEAALTAGLDAAGGDVVVLIDADLQHPPALIPVFVRHWQAGADVVCAVRADRRDEGFLKRWGSRVFYGLLNAADRFEVPADASDFRLMDRRVVEALRALPERNRFLKGLYAWVGFSMVAVPYVPAPRAAGRSHYDHLRLTRLALDGLTAFTTWPLRAVAALGFVLASLAFAYGGWLTVSYLLNGHSINGWTTIVVSVMLFAGIQLISIGVLGAYIGRIFEEVKGRPLYVVRRAAGQGLPAPGRA